MASTQDVPGQATVQSGSLRTRLLSCREAFQKAANAAPLIELFYRIAGRAVRLQFAGQSLSKTIHLPLAHLQIPPCTSVDLTVSLWDSRSTNTPLPEQARFEVPPPNSPAESQANVQQHRFICEKNGISAQFWPESETFTLIDTQSGEAFFWISDSTKMSVWDRAKPLRSILSSWSRSQGLQLIHGAGVGYKNGGAILVGKSGSGKSTAALSCLQQGLGYAGDDYLLVDPIKLTAHSLYNTAMLHSGRFDSFVELLPGEPSPGEKSLVFPGDVYEDKLLLSFPIKALLVANVSDNNKIDIIPISSGAGLAALAASTLFQLPGAAKQDLHSMATLVRNVPCFKMTYGSDLSEIGLKIRKIIG